MKTPNFKLMFAALAAAAIGLTPKAWATGELPGIFSVSATKKVQFSQGNLQAVFASAGNSCAWQFADNQYDYVGYAAANNAINGNGSVSAAGKVDLFGWSTASTYYGINNSGDAVDYSGDFVDWGNLAISNGGNTENSGWRTLTRDEWAYLFSNHTFGFATVAGVKGVIIAPDNYAGPPIDSNHRNGQDSFANNTIDVSTWQSTYVPAGVVFLPAAGFRLPWIGQVQENAYYWSSSAVGGGNENSFAILLGLVGNEFQINFAGGGNWPASDGFSVRLVKNIYTISYDANSGSGAPSEQMKYHGIDLNLSGVAPTRAGYLFKGWNTAADGSGTSYASGATFTDNADTMLYAQWMNGYEVRAEADGITVSEDTASTYVPTTIVNGSFDEEPWMVFTYDGVTYYSCKNDADFISWGTAEATDVVFNGVDMGWNTTERSWWRSSLFEYANGNIATHTISHNSTISNTGKYVEMNCYHACMLYQDLTTHGNDVIRWSLNHAVTTGGDETQAMRVEIGAPNRDGSGNIVNASGWAANLNPQIELASKAIYRSTGVTDKDGNLSTFGFGSVSELQYLTVTKTDNGSGWWNAQGVYVVPQGQTATRFGFVSEASTPDRGNLLDDITFSTLIGNLSARQLESYDVELKGYWGETDATKCLKVVIGSTTYNVDMTSVVGKNFKIVIPAATIGAATSVHVYHQDYEDAGRTIALMSVLKSWEREYTGDIQTFTAPCSGIYQLRVWGAQGGWFSNQKSGGLGGYATCRTTLTKGEIIYIYVGGRGGHETKNGGAGGWNGGGKGGNGVNGYNGSAGGGGATHISKVNNQVIGGGSGQCASLAGTEYIIVAGGGGGAGHPYTTAGDGGGRAGGLGMRYDDELKAKVTYSANFYCSTSQSYGANGGNGCAHSWACEGAGGGGGGYYGGTANVPNGDFSSACQDAGGCGGNSAYNSDFATEFSTIAGQREGNGKAQIVLLVSQDEIDAHVGKVIGADGKMYKTVAAATNAGTTASGIIAYWGWAGSVESGTNYRGMALSLENMYYSFTQSYGMKYCALNNYETGCSGFSYCNSLSDALNTLNGIAATTGLCEINSSHNSGHEAAAVARAYAKACPAGASAWSIPSMGQWNLMAKALTGGSDISETDNQTYAHDNISVKIAAVGGANLTWALYWSTTEKDATHAWTFDIGAISDAYSRNGGRANSIRKEYGGAEYVRAFFAFEDATDAVYTISYNANGGSGAPSAQTKDGGIDLSLSSTEPTREGCAFAGWATSVNGEVAYQAGDTFTGNADTTLYAQWEIVLDDETATVETAADCGQGDSVAAIPVSVNIGEGISSKTGVTVRYELDQVTKSGEVVSEGATTESADDLSIDLTSVVSNAYFKVAAVVESTDGTGAKTKVASETTIGVLAVTNAPKTAIIGVPWKSLAGEDISVDKLVRTENLTKGDQIMVYDSSTGDYKAWALNEGKTWDEVATVTANESPMNPGAASATSVARGSGVWLTRKDPSQPIYLVGKFVDEAVKTDLETPDEPGEQKWNLVASPKVEPVDVAILLNERQATDKVMVPSAGAPKNFIYNATLGKWGYIDYRTGEDGRVRAFFREDDTLIQPGTGFWYLNGDTTHDSLAW